MKFSEIILFIFVWIIMEFFFKFLFINDSWKLKEYCYFDVEKYKWGDKIFIVFICIISICDFVFFCFNRNDKY